MDKSHLIPKGSDKTSYLSKDRQENVESEKEDSIHSSVSVNVNEKDQEKVDTVDTGSSWRTWRKNQVVPAILLCAVAVAGVCHAPLFTCLCVQ